MRNTHSLLEEEIRQKIETGTQQSKKKILADKSADMDMALLTIDVEKDLLLHIILPLSKNQITYEQAHMLAKQFLSLLPLQDKQDLLGKLQKVGEDYPNIGINEIYLKYALPYEEEERQKKLETMRDHIQNAQIEHAIVLAKGGIPHG